MTAYVLEREQSIPSDRETVFAFFKTPENLAQITPPWLGFQIREASDPTVRAGTRIRYTLKWWIIPIAWESLIAEYREGTLFADEMVKGPYKRWYHTHAFESRPDGVVMRDRVEYELPLGPFGRLAHALVVRRQLQAIFDYRAQRIREIFTPQ